jgi:hypothetical protein
MRIGRSIGFCSSSFLVYSLLKDLQKSIFHFWN